MKNVGNVLIGLGVIAITWALVPAFTSRDIVDVVIFAFEGIGAVFVGGLLIAFGSITIGLHNKNQEKLERAAKIHETAKEIERQREEREQIQALIKASTTSDQVKSGPTCIVSMEFMGEREEYHLGLDSEDDINAPIKTYASAPPKRKDIKFSNATTAKSFVAIDLETTGLYASISEIIEIAAIKVVSGEIKDKYVTFVKPQNAIPKKITRINGIDNLMVSDAPSIEVCMPILIEFISDLPIVAHNASFDIGFISANWDTDIDNKIIDTLKLARRFMKEVPNHKLPTLMNCIGEDNSGMHRAEQDALNVVKLYAYIARTAADERKRRKE